MDPCIYSLCILICLYAIPIVIQILFLTIVDSAVSVMVCLECCYDGAMMTIFAANPFVSFKLGMSDRHSLLVIVVDFVSVAIAYNGVCILFSGYSLVVLTNPPGGSGIRCSSKNQSAYCIIIMETECVTRTR